MNATGILTQPGTVDAGRLLSHSLNDRETWRQSEALVRSCLREASVLGTADDLPCTTVNHGKISVHIHGIVHGGSLFSRPAGRVRRFVQARVLEYAGPTGLNCLCEERFSRYWGLHLDIDIDDITRTPGAAEFVRLKLEHLRDRSAEADPECSASRQRIARMLHHVIRKALRDERHLGTVRAVYDILPYPVVLRDDPGSIIEFYNDLLRSKYMAEYLISFGALAGIPELHALVGLGHEHEIEYFIHHMDAAPDQCILELSSV